MKKWGLILFIVLLAGLSQAAQVATNASINEGAEWEKKAVMLNVMHPHFGARPSASDNRAAFQKVMDSLSARGGGIFYVPSKDTFFVDSVVYYPESNTVIWIDGYVMFDSTSGRSVGFQPKDTSKTSHDIVFMGGGTIDGQNPYTDYDSVTTYGAQDFIYLYNVRDVKVNGPHIKNAKRDAIGVRNSNNVEINNPDITGSGEEGITLNGPGGNHRINGGYIEGQKESYEDGSGQKGSGILIKCNNSTVNGTHIKYTGCGIDINAEDGKIPYNNKIVNCTIDSASGSGIAVIGGNGCLIDNNALTHVKGYNIFVSRWQSSDTHSVNISIVNNKVDSTSAHSGYSRKGYGIYVEYGRGHEITGNTINNYDDVGIGLSSIKESMLGLNVINDGDTAVKGYEADSCSFIFNRGHDNTVGIDLSNSSDYCFLTPGGFLNATTQVSRKPATTGFFNYRMTADSLFITKHYADNLGITDQSIKGDDVDSTAENFVFNDAYRGTSAVSDSQFITKHYADGLSGVGEVNTLSDTGTYDGSSGFGLAGGKTGTALKVRGLIEGSNITITASGDSAYSIASSGGGGGDYDFDTAGAAKYEIVVFNKPDVSNDSDFVTKTIAELSLVDTAGVIRVIEDSISGDATVGAGGVFDLSANAVDEDELNMNNGPSDNDILAYDGVATGMEWQSFAELGLIDTSGTWGLLNNLDTNFLVGSRSDTILNGYTLNFQGNNGGLFWMDGTGLGTEGHLYWDSASARMVFIATNLTLGATDLNVDGDVIIADSLAAQIGNFTDSLIVSGDVIKDITGQGLTITSGVFRVDTANAVANGETKPVTGNAVYDWVTGLYFDTAQVVDTIQALMGTYVTDANLTDSLDRYFDTAATVDTIQGLMATYVTDAILTDSLDRYFDTAAVVDSIQALISGLGSADTALTISLDGSDTIAVKWSDNGDTLIIVDSTGNRLLLYYDAGWVFDGGGGLTVFDSALIDTILYFVSAGGTDTAFITNVFLDSIRAGNFGVAGTTDTVRIGTGLVATGVGGDTLAAPGDTISVDPDAYASSSHDHDGVYLPLTGGNIDSIQVESLEVVTDINLPVNSLKDSMIPDNITIDAATYADSAGTVTDGALSSKKFATNTLDSIKAGVKAWDTLALVLDDTTNWNTVKARFDSAYDFLTTNPSGLFAIGAGANFTYGAVNWNSGDSINGAAIGPQTIPGSKLTTALHDSLVNGATAYGWGDHASAGYSTFGAEVDATEMDVSDKFTGAGYYRSDSTVGDSLCPTKRYVDSLTGNVTTDLNVVGDVRLTGQVLSKSEMKRLDTSFVKAERAASKLKIWHKKFGAETDTNQMIHPSVVAAPESFGPDAGDTMIAYNSSGNLDTVIATAGTPKWKYWLAGTPYPGSNGAAENPHLRVANRPNGDVDSNKFIPPYGIGTDPTDGDAVDTVWVRDPIFDSTYLEYPDSASHLSDPELIFSKEGDLWCIFRFSYVKNDSNHEVIMGVPSVDGITWRIADSSYLMYYPDTGIFTDIACPQIVLDTGGSYKMYYTDIVYQHLSTPDQDDSNVVVMVSASDIDSMFGNAVICNVSAPTNILDPWHFDVKRRGSQYDMFMAFSDTLNSHIHCDSGLYYYQSDNGTDFTIKNKMFLRKSTVTSAWDYKMLYKPEALWIDDGLGGRYGLWYSALSNTSTWGTGYTEIKFKDTTALLATPGDTTSGAYLFSGTVKFTGTVQRGTGSIGDSAFATLDYVKFHDTGSVSALIWDPETITDTIPIFYCDSAKYPYGVTIQSINCQTDADGAYALKFFIYSATDPPVLHDYIDTLNIGASDQRASSVTFEDANANDVAVGQFVYILTPTDDKNWLRLSFRYIRKKS